MLLLLILAVENRPQDHTVPGHLMQAQVEIFDSSKCRYSNFNSGQQICAGGSNMNSTGICSGDSGGPLIKQVNGKWTLFGITSYSHIDQCAHPRFADGFTRVQYYRDWINAKLKLS